MARRPPGAPAVAVTFACAVLFSLLLPAGVGTGALPPRAPTSPGAATPGERPSAPDLSTPWWPTYEQNPGRTGAAPGEYVLSPRNASQLGLLWSATTPGVIESSPIVADGKVFVTSWDGNVSAFDLRNGTLAWRTFVGTTTFPSCNYAKPRGPTSSVSVLNGTLYVGGGTAEFWALNATTGAKEWNVSEVANSPGGGDYNWASPLVYGNAAYVGLSSACGAPDVQGMVIEINVNGSSHAVTHTFAVVPSGQTGGGVWSTSALDPSTNLLWVTTGSESSSGLHARSVLALNATTLALVGAWQQPTSGADYDFGAGPTLFHDGSGRPLVGAENKNGVFYALNRSNASTTGWAPVWEDNVSWYDNYSTHQQACGCALSPAAFDGSTLYIGGGYARLANGTNVAGTLRAVDPANGTPRWIQPAYGLVRAGLAEADGLLIDAANANDNASAMLEVRNASSGTVLYGYPVSGTINGPPSVADGIVLFGNGSWSLRGPGTLLALSEPLGANATVANGTAGLAYDLTGSATGGVPPESGSWSFGDGTSANGSGTVVHAYPRPGAYVTNFTVADATGAVATATVLVRAVDPAVRIPFFDASPSNATLGATVTLLVGVNGGTPPYSFSYGGLPAGCATVNLSILDCRPSQAGSSTVTVFVQDAFGNGANASTNFTILTVPSTLGILLLVVAPDTVPVNGSIEVYSVATGGAPPYEYRYTGLPPGCTAGDFASFRCTPSVPGNYSIGLTVLDIVGASATATVALDVEQIYPEFPAPVLVADPSTIELGQNLTLATYVAGGEPPLRFVYTVPPGCASLDTTLLSCTPDRIGTFTASVTVTDAIGRSRNASTTLSVVAAPLAGPTGTSSPSAPVWVAPAIAGAFAVGAATVALATVLRRRRPPTPPVDRPPGRP